MQLMQLLLQQMQQQRKRELLQQMAQQQKAQMAQQLQAMPHSPLLVLLHLPLNSHSQVGLQRTCIFVFVLGRPGNLQNQQRHRSSFGHHQVHLLHRSAYCWRFGSRGKLQ
jgi:hypothetical protein